MAIQKCNKTITPSSNTRGINGLSIDGRTYFDDVWHDLNLGAIKCELARGHKGKHEAHKIKKTIIFNSIIWSD
jgi:hypothetical protein